MSKLGQKLKPWLLSAGLLGLAACEYLPHSAKVELSKQEVAQVVEQAKFADDAIMQAFEKHNFVAIGDYHWNDAFVRYATELVVKPEFSQQVNHVVVEFGNAKFQTVLDDYLSGDEVSEDQLNSVLRGALYFMAWMPDVYRDFFKAIKQRNEDLPEGEKIRVHLAEAPFDWDTVQDVKVWKQAASHKTDYFYQIAAERIKNNERALMIFGAFHLINAPKEYVAKSTQSDWPLATRLEQAFPGSVYSIWPMTDPEAVKTFGAAKTPAILDVRKGPIQELRLIDFLPKARYKLSEMDKMDAQVGELFDAFLYLGENQRTMTLPRDVIADRAWVEEMQRRVDIIGGKMQTRFNELRELSEKQHGSTSKS
ncbi:hypothetical protein [Vibrio sp. B1FLJ16]|uniref:hypothetical protein n=1 Tax=Vibrio sp. B1FLJ16 TaxID=2751178 RepID=UPI0015F7231D|nr:hypothetical protein [Vibrio sp. B1FLJ16]CAD7802034.1 hypothetical protein ACOMICROBIO_EPCKBFOG_00890 [Vibrio sp. B1FLJ16]CAE6892515.1 hypothetical protein ACOMICROBIO_EPCKBFOG_00890 [Vibrio sp. B1FLJ16]